MVGFDHGWSQSCWLGLSSKGNTYLDSRVRPLHTLCILRRYELDATEPVFFKVNSKKNKSYIQYSNQNSGKSLNNLSKRQKDEVIRKHYNYIRFQAVSGK